MASTWRSGRLTATRMYGCWRISESARAALGSFKLSSAHDARALLHVDKLVGLDVLDGVDLAAGPVDLQHVDLVRLAKAEMNPQIALREIAAATADFVDLLVRLVLAGYFRYAFQACSDSSAIGLRANSAHFEPVVAGTQVAAHELRVIVHGVDDDVQVAIIVKVAKSATARGDGIGNS